MLVSVLVLVIAKPLNHNWGQWGLDDLHKERKTKRVMRCFEWKGSRSQLWSVASVIIKCLNDWINSYYLVIVCQVQSRREECSDLCDCIYQLYSWFLRKLDIPVIRRLSGDKLNAVFITTPVYCTRAARVALYFSCVLKATHTGRVLYPPLSAYCIDLAPGPPAPSLCSPSSFSLLPVFCSPANLCQWLTVQTLKNKLLLTSAETDVRTAEDLKSCITRPEFMLYTACDTLINVFLVKSRLYQMIRHYKIPEIWAFSEPGNICIIKDCLTRRSKLFPSRVEVALCLLQISEWSPLNSQGPWCND